MPVRTIVIEWLRLYRHFPRTEIVQDAGSIRQSSLYTRESRGSREKGLFLGAEYLGSRVSKILISRVWDFREKRGLKIKEKIIMEKILL